MAAVTVPLRASAGGVASSPSAGEDAAAAPDDPTDTLVRSARPRRQDVNDEVTGIDGSTRMEAKRQRRRAKVARQVGVARPS